MTFLVAWVLSAVVYVLFTNHISTNPEMYAYPMYYVWGFLVVTLFAGLVDLAVNN